MRAHEDGQGQAWSTDGQPGVVLAYKAPVKPAAKRRVPLPQRERIAAAR